MAVEIKDYVEPLYEFLRDHAGRDEDTGVLVTHAFIHPWLMDRFGLTHSQAHHVRYRAVKELESQGRVRRDHPNKSKVWILQ